jgi:putative ABC transport system permease protein
MFVAIGAGVVMLAIIVAITRQAAVARLAFKNFLRRPGQTFLIVAGLLIASLVISSALVAGEATESMFLSNVYRVWGPVDAVLGTLSGKPLPIAEARRILDDGSVRSLSDGGSPRLQLEASIEAQTVGTRERLVNLIGIDPQEDSTLGDFTAITGERVTDPGGGVLINQRLADRLGVHVGDPLTLITTGFDAKPVSIKLAVTTVAVNSGKANFQLRPDAFVRLDSLQQALKGRGQVNQVALSANGSDLNPERVKLFETVAFRVANKAAPDQTLKRKDIVYRLSGTKSQSIRSAKEQSGFFQSVLTALGALVALTAIVLIANLFVMLGEERRSERAMMRALGLKNSGMLLLGLGEGLLYSLTASALGAVIGSLLGRRIGETLVDLYGQLLRDLSVEFVTPDFKLSVGTLITAASAGFLVSVVAVGAITLRTSRFSVVAAIRGLREPRAAGRTSAITDAVLMGGGALMILAGALGDFRGTEVADLLGGTAFLIGLSRRLVGVTGLRFGATVGGLVVIGWSLWGYVFLPDFENDFDLGFSIVTLAAVIIVVAGVVVLSVNLQAIQRIASVFGARMQAVIRTATAYPVGYRFRTAMAMLMFALVLYMIAAFAIWGGLATGDFDSQSGGYDVFASSTVPVSSLSSNEAADVTALYATRYELGYRVKDSPEVRFPVPIYGVDATPARTGQFRFIEKQKNLSEAQVWEALAASTDAALLDVGTSPGNVKAGQILELNTDKGLKPLRILGVVDEFWLAGLFVSKQTFAELYPTRAAATAWLISAKPNVAPGDLARSIEARYPGVGLDAKPVQEIFDESVTVQRTFLGLFQVLLKLGLAIGITGLVISSIRTVLERRHAIGVMRALGFKRYVVGLSLLFESFLVATLGCGIGLVAGLGGTYWLTKKQLTNLSFNADWSQIGTTLEIVYAAIFIFTIIPAARAAFISPADAVRYVE